MKSQNSAIKSSTDTRYGFMIKSSRRELKNAIQNIQSSVQELKDAKMHLIKLLSFENIGNGLIRGPGASACLTQKNVDEAKQKVQSLEAQLARASKRFEESKLKLAHWESKLLISKTCDKLN